MGKQRECREAASSRVAESEAVTDTCRPNCMGSLTAAKCCDTKRK